MSFRFRLREIDWDFGGSYSESPFAAIHWHPGLFASQVPAALIGLLSNPGDTILDPFAGSGTTLVEAQRLGRQSIGIDLNPVSCMIARSKTKQARGSEVRESEERLVEDATRVIKKAKELDMGEADRLLPESVQLEKWYVKEVGRDLAHLWRLVKGYQKSLDVDLARFAFSAILMKVCRETRHWGYICDNSTPRDNRGGNVLEEYSNVLKELTFAYELRDRELEVQEIGRIPPAIVLEGDAVKRMNELEPASVDLIVTSPPYFGVCDYVKSQRLTLEWFGTELECLRQQEIGARSKRRRRRARQEYLEELEAVLRASCEGLRPGGYMALIVGESSARESVVDEIREAVLEGELEIEVEMSRKVSAQRRQAPSIHGERLVIFEKMEESGVGRDAKTA